ncbi:MAG TPA: hydroxyisourate hydrolase [Puia sp.]|nr:hydroxyisourate hydrolase [Puia sp.]
MIGITTHILDTATGRPALGVPVILFLLPEGDGPLREIARGTTDADGRLRDLLPPGKVVGKGVYKLRFGTKEYFARQAEGLRGAAEPGAVASLYPFVEIIFEISTDEHYHIPLLLSPYGYSTYRGS